MLKRTRRPVGTRLHGDQIFSVNNNIINIPMTGKYCQPTSKRLAIWVGKFKGKEDVKRKA